VRLDTQAVVQELDFVPDRSAPRYAGGRGPSAQQENRHRGILHGRIDRYGTERSARSCRSFL